jgi:hypothetical protein
MTLAQQSATLLENIKQCVAEKMKGKKELPNMTTPPYYEPNDIDIRSEETDAFENEPNLNNELGDLQKML